MAKRSIWQTLQVLAAEQRRALIRREASAVADLTARMTGVDAAIARELNRVESKIIAAQAAGEPIGRSWISRKADLARMQVELEAALADWQGDANAMILAAQADAAALGTYGAQQMIGASLPDGYAGTGFSFGGTNLGQASNLVAAMNAGLPIVDLATGTSIALTEQAEAALLEAVVMGKNPRDVIAALRQSMPNMPRYQAERIARTEMGRASAAAALERYNESEYVGRWVWIAHPGSCCAGCLAKHGTIHSLDEAMGKHVNCRCTMGPVTPSYADLGIPGIEDPMDQFYAEAAAAGETMLAGMSLDELTRRFGPGKAKLIHDGTLQLPDLLHVRTHPYYGPANGEASLRQAQANALARRNQRGEGALTKSDLIENYRKMYGKDPSPAMLKKLERRRGA